MSDAGDAQKQLPQEKIRQGGEQERIAIEGTTEDHVDSQVYTTTSLSFKSEESRHNAQPLVLDWAYGSNQTLPVLSLLDEDRIVVLFVCAQVAVMFDHTSNTQQFLQGHCSPITCMCTSEDRRWLVTADMGQDSLVIIWDTYTGIPVRTLFNCHPEGGVCALTLSRDSKYLATIGAGNKQRVCIWDWTNESDGPKCQVEIDLKFSFQNQITFSVFDCTQLLSSSERHIIFYKWEKGYLKYSAPEVSNRIFREEIGSLTQSIFHSNGVQAFTATSAGNVIVWDKHSELVSFQPPRRKAIKLVPLQNAGITVLTRLNSFLVTGDVKGNIKFYDEKLLFLNVYNEFSSEPIRSISFSKEPSSTSCLVNPEYSIPYKSKALPKRNLVFSTSRATVVHVDAKKAVPQTLLKGHAEHLEAVSCHPKQPLVAMGSHSGLIKVWNYERKELFCTKVFQPNEEVQCICYDPQGIYFAVGFVSGVIQILDASTLESKGEEKEWCFSYSQNCIIHLTFSMDSRYLAAADTGKAVSLFQLYEEGTRKIWKFQGRHQSHYKPIQDLLFGVDLESGNSRLISAGMDRVLVEYDLVNSDRDALLILSSNRIEQSAVPTCMMWYPPLTPEQFLLTATNHYKMKLFNPSFKMCRKTLFGPISGSPLKKMVLLPKSSDMRPESYYMAYITRDMLGIQILPVDGNPHKSFKMMCHSAGVCTLAYSYDGRYVFTAGGQDCTVFSWKLNLLSLEALALLGGVEMLPFYNLLEGGRDGQLFRDMEHYFFYSQLQNPDINTMETRLVTTHIPLTDVPLMIRALDLNPTEQELEDIHNEIKYSRYARTKEYMTDIDLEEFIKLYVNRPPAAGISNEELCNAFQVLGRPDEEGRNVIDRDEMVALLQTRGEQMTESELVECLTTLFDLDAEGCTTAPFPDTQSLVESVLPLQISMENFLKDILQF